MKPATRAEPVTNSAQQETRAALRLVLTYAVFAGLWILLSDAALAWLLTDPLLIAAASTIKGWLFVALTSLLLYGLLQRLLKQIHAITERELGARKETTHAKQLLEVIADSSLDAIFAKDLAGRYLLCNRAAALAVGKSTAQIIGCDDGALFPPEQADRIRASDLRAIAEEQVITGEQTLTTVAGERTYHSLKGPLRDGDGQVIGIYCIARDITERKRADEALRASEAEFRAFFNTEASGAAMIAPDGRFLKVNEALCRMTGYTADELLQIGPAALTHPDDVAVENKLLSTYLGGQQHTYQVEKRNLRKDGSVIWVQVNAALIRDESGKVLCSAGTVHDVTARKEAEARHEQALLKAEAATRAKSEFLAHMSHEIRTPMNAIVGAARLIEYENLTPRQLGYTEIMRHSGQALLSIIDDILDLSKIEAGQIEFKAEAFDLADLANRLVQAASVSALGKNLGIRLDLAPDLPPLLIGDAQRLEQVLNNLLSNAVKFTSTGEIILRVQKLAADAEQARLFFIVSDSGIGISAQKLSAIFDPFVQAENTTTRTQGGTGLGLSISRRLVEMMGGVIEVESVPGQGSDFAFTAVFRLPPATGALAKAVAKAATVPPAARELDDDAFPPAASALAGRRVLIVEDNEFNRLVLEGMLQHLGIEVDAAIDGDDGVESFQVGNPYDAILMDLHMPGCNGFDCTRAIRALPEGRTVPIIAVTANILSTTVSECHAAGMNEHLLKPVEPETLQRSLLHWILGENPGEILDENPAHRSKAPAPDKDPTDRLPDDLPGLDPIKASAWSNGSARTLAELLDRALAHSGDDPAKLLRHLAAGDLEAAAQITHDLMAVAATLGASTLVAAARQLNREIRAGNPGSSLAQEAVTRIGVEFSQLKMTQAILVKSSAR